MLQSQHSRPTALVTGASSGIGKAFAELFAQERYDLVVVARSEDRLLELERELEATYSVSVTVIAADLCDPTAPSRIYSTVAESGLAVDVLVNNAGMGGYGRFDEADLERDLDMIQLNVTALMHLTKLFVRDMVARNRGSVINVASTAAFFSGPFQPVYYATKAFVVSLSEALYEELRDTNITVTVLCPGQTRSEFHERSGTRRSELARSRMATAESVAEAGYRAMRAGKRLVVPGWMNKVFVFIPRLLPRGVMLKLVRGFQKAAGSQE